MYGIDLREACYGQPKVGARRIFALVRGLPMGGALHKALHPDTFAWTHQDELLAIIAEILDHGNRLFLMANTKKGAKMPPPLEIARPGRPSRKELEKQRRKPSHQEVVDFFSRKGR